MAEKAKETQAQPNQPSKDELIGYHKGAINTLVAERNELIRVVQVTEGLIQAHAKELESLGVNISQKEASQEKK